MTLLDAAQYNLTLLRWPHNLCESPKVSKLKIKSAFPTSTLKTSNNRSNSNLLLVSAWTQSLVSNNYQQVSPVIGCLGYCCRDQPPRSFPDRSTYMFTYSDRVPANWFTKVFCRSELASFFVSKIEFLVIHPRCACVASAQKKRKKKQICTVISASAEHIQSGW